MIKEVFLFKCRHRSWIFYALARSESSRDRRKESIQGSVKNFVRGVSVGATLFIDLVIPKS